MTVTVLFFGALSDVMGRQQVMALPSDGITADGLKRHLLEASEDLAALVEDAPIKMAVNNTVVGGDHRLNDGDEIAFLPPFSGG